MGGAKLIGIGLMAYDGELPVEVQEMLRGFDHLVWSRGWQTQLIRSVGNCRVHHARNALVTAAIDANVNDLLLIDKDNYTSPETLMRICEAPLDYVGLVIRGRDREVIWNVRWITERPYVVAQNPATGEPDENGFVEVDGIGTGILKLSRACLDRMVSSYSERWYHDLSAPGGKSIELFSFPVEEHLAWGEDLAFGRLWKALGGKIWIDPHATTWHLARVWHEGNIGQWLRQGGEQQQPEVNLAGLQANAQALEALTKDLVDITREVDRRRNLPPLPKVAMLIPTRGRPDSLLENLKITIANSKLDDTSILVGVDYDEVDLYDMVWRELGLDKKKVVVSTSPREDDMGSKYNRCHRDSPAADLYVLFADDIAMATPGWDVTLAEQARRAFPDNIGVVYFGTPPVPTAMSPGLAITAGLIEKMGYFARAGFPSSWFCSDTTQYEIATMIDRVHRIGSLVELTHKGLGKSRGVRDSVFWRAYFDALRPEREEIARKIIKSNDFKVSDAHRVALWNDIQHKRALLHMEGEPLRNQKNAKHVEQAVAFDAPADERYLRVKRAAEAHLATLTPKANAA